MLLIRSRGVARIVQLMLVVIMLEWTRTTVILVNERQANQEPWHRMAVILLSVAAFALLAALLFFAPPVRRRYPASLV
jgi:hypothetical protein